MWHVSRDHGSTLACQLGPWSAMIGVACWRFSSRSALLAVSSSLVITGDVRPWSWLCLWRSWPWSWMLWPCHQNVALLTSLVITVARLSILSLLFYAPPDMQQTISLLHWRIVCHPRRRHRCRLDTPLPPPQMTKISPKCLWYPKKATSPTTNRLWFSLDPFATAKLSRITRISLTSPTTKRQHCHRLHR